LEKKVNGQTENDFAEAAALFRSIDGYKDSSLLANECDDLAKKAHLKAKQEIFQKALLKKNNGQTENDFVEAAELFKSISDYMNSNTLMESCYAHVLHIKDAQDKTKHDTRVKQKSIKKEKKNNKLDGCGCGFYFILIAIILIALIIEFLTY